MVVNAELVAVRTAARTRVEIYTSAGTSARAVAGGGKTVYLTLWSEEMYDARNFGRMESPLVTAADRSFVLAWEMMALVVEAKELIVCKIGMGKKRGPRRV